MSFSAPRSVHVGSDFWVRLGHLLSRHKWARFPRKEEPGIGLEEAHSTTVNWLCQPEREDLGMEVKESSGPPTIGFLS